jgi:hypothetical protein
MRYEQIKICHSVLDSIFSHTVDWIGHLPVLYVVRKYAGRASTTDIKDAGS